MSYNDYADHYNQDSFWEKLGNYAKKIGWKGVFSVLTMYYCLQDPNTPRKAKGIIVGAFGYLVLPLDLVPDLVPVVGFTDDLAVIAWAMGVVALHIEETHKQKARERMQAFFGSGSGEPAT